MCAIFTVMGGGGACVAPAYGGKFVAWIAIRFIREIGFLYCMCRGVILFHVMSSASANLNPESVSSYRWRAVRKDDIPAVYAMLAAGVEMDRPFSHPSELRLAHLYGLLGERLAQDTLLAFAPDGSLAAEAFIFFPPPDGERLALLDGHVHVNHRGLGLGGYLLGWLESRARQEFSEAGESLPQLLRISCAAHQSDRIALFEQHGFRAARYSYTMQRGLDGSWLDVSQPSGVQLLPWSPAIDPAVMHAFNLAFRGQWGVPSMTPELWGEFFTGVPQFRSDLSCLALTGDDVIGFCINWVMDTQGWIEALGVVPSWRGRGVASALLAHSLNLFQQASLPQAALDVDAENPTGALRLYQKLGFAAIRQEIHFVKRLS
jgi:mycothiol synthase